MTGIHRILQRQIKKARHASGAVDMGVLQDLVSRTYTEDEDDSRRTDRSIQLMVDELDAVNLDLSTASERLRITLEAVHHGIMMVNAAGEIHVCNGKARELLQLPAALEGRAFMFSELVEALDRAMICDRDDAGTITAEMPDGRLVEVYAEPTAEGGRVILVEDVTADRARERALRQAEAEYRSLFENSIYGVYRDTLDGKPIRVNLALAHLNRYENEQEDVAAVRANPKPWYVDKERYAEFLRLLERDGKVTDLISQVYRHKTGEVFWITENAWYVRDEHGNPLFIEGTILDATERIESQQALHRLANVDTLTGARSRYNFVHCLDEEVARHDTPFVLYCIDLDMFKDVNDVFGHAAGDAVLRTVTERLSALAHQTDVVARLGGDEFAILCKRQEVAANPEVLASGIVAAMRAAIPLDGRNHHIGASVGIARFPDHGTTSEELLRNADTALYEAKGLGRNGWHLFDLELRMRLEQRKSIEDQLRGAIHRGELDLHFQPIMASGTGRCAGFEALLRWNSAVLGNVPPADFIPVAEQAGLLAEIGNWVLSETCAAAAALPGNLSLSVNLSASQFRSPGLLPHIERQLAFHGLDPRRLVLEITESVLVSNETAARQLLDDLRRLGVKIAIDDFGTGYSSLSYLQHLPISIVKIDRSFVAGMLGQKANLAVIRAVLGIGRDLGINVVAEGVETEEQAAVLRKEGCRYIQGFLYSAPKPLAEVVADLSVDLLGRQMVMPRRKTA